MNITDYSHSEDFWTDNQAVILSHILEAELMYLNARNNIGADQGFFGMSVRDGESTLLAIQTLPYPMIFFGHGGDLRPLAARMAELLLQRRKIPETINGSVASTEIMLDALLEKGVAYIAGRHLLQRRCDVLEDIPTLAMPLINANEVTYDFCQDYQSFLEECHASYDPAKLQQDIDSMLLSNDLYVLTEQGEVVTMGRLQRKLPKGRAVGVIYTPPVFRGRGYSTCCTKQLTRRVFEDGYSFAYLYAEADNPVSNHVYEKLGYQKIDDYIEYHRRRFF